MHGYLSSKEAFLAQIEYFSRFYKVTAIDFLGFGQSGELKAPFSVSDYARWLKDILKKLNIEKPHILAHSFGCRVAVTAGQLYPNIFDKIVLTGPAGIILPRTLRYKSKVKVYKIVKKIAPKWAEKHFGSKEYRGLSPIMKESYKKIVNEDLRDRAKEVFNPVLIVEGEEDTVTTLQEAEIYLHSFPNANLRVMQGGHFAFAQFPIAFNLTVEEFLYE